MPLLPRVPAITLPAGLMAAAGCMLLSSSLLFASTKTTSPHGLRQHDNDELFKMHNRRQLAQKLMNHMEMIRYDDNPKMNQMQNENNQPSAVASSFWWDDIYYEQKPLCGQVKCFFLSVSDPAHGYLIWDSSYANTEDDALTENALNTATQAYKYAAKVQSEDDNIRQFFTSPPFQMGTPEVFEQQLTKEYKVMFPDGTKSLIIQPSLTAPEGSIIIRCYNDRVLYNRLDHILQNGKPHSKERLVEELERNIPFVQSHQELAKDFQLMIDLEGRTYHLDFDRIQAGFKKMRPERFDTTRICLENAVKYVKKSMEMTES